ncbi:apoptosis-antagonizing transcription factor [Astrocystis sublimbata]|nr:apoptosis-antagonizing transcription factor [Astrocystis sublimbata]
MVKKQGRARELADLIERPVKDYDPEADQVPDDSDDASDSGSDDDGSDAEVAGTEHYEAVGKSKLRRNEPVVLGPQYRGARVSREDLEAEDDDEDEDEEDEEDSEDNDGSSSNYEDAVEEFDDPDAADLVADQKGHEDDEIDSDDIVGGDDRFAELVLRGKKKSRHAKRATAADFMGSDSEEEEGIDDEDLMDDSDDVDDEEDLSDDASETGGLIDDEAEESDDGESGFDDEDDLSEGDSEEDEEDDDEDDDDEDEETGSRRKPKQSSSALAASVKEMMGEQGVVKSLLKTVDADVQKGKAVQRQRKGFDALLNVRIRLQKSIVATNSIKYAEQDEDPAVAEPYEAAERSALQLWNALDEFRTNIHKGKKRKHVETDDDLTTTLWNRMQLHERHQAARRKQVLEKWSRDAKKTSITASSANKFTRNSEKPITAMINDELEAPERLIKRTRTPRSCAPYQVAQKVNEDQSIYDDADFYQLLLKELVDQRSGDGSGAGLQAATVRYAAVKEAKAKRHVDTKASKGRKMRFAPIPKLQNFMAPEDRRGWEQSAIDRFFGTLFGQKMVLDEESSDEEMGGVGVGDEGTQGLRLF